MRHIEVVPEKVAWVLLRDGRVLVTRNRGLFDYGDRARVSAVDQMVFDALHISGQPA